MQRMNCPRCGEYSYQVKRSGDLASQLRDLQGLLKEKDSQARANASGFLYENPGRRLVTEEDVQALAGQSNPSFHDRADKVLLAIEKGSLFIGYEVPIDFSTWLGRAWCRRTEELKEILRYLVSEKRIELISQATGHEGDHAKILASGWARLEQLKGTNRESNQAFVAMWFDKAGMMQGV